MKKICLKWICVAALTGLASCAQRLPDVADFDRSYQKAEELARADRAELESRRGQMSDAEYQRAKADLESRISDRAISMVWTRHSLEETQRENLGIPSPDHPQSISVPQAGSLPTGSDYRRFDQQMDAAYGSSGETISGMRQMMGSSNLGSNIRGNKSSPY
jgi:hypothetical protein